MLCIRILSVNQRPENCPFQLGHLNPHCIFPGPTWLSIPNCISIGSAVLQFYTAHCRESLYFTMCIKIRLTSCWLGAARQEGHLACKRVVRYWLFYLSWARCKWFAYGPTDAIATPSSLAAVKSRMVCVSGAGLPRLSWKKAVKRM